MNEIKNVFENKFTLFLFWYSFVIMFGSYFMFFFIFLAAYLNGGIVTIGINAFGEANIELFLIVSGLIGFFFVFKIITSQLKKNKLRI